MINMLINERLGNKWFILCRWPFAALCDQMCVDVLSPQWEVRHGAAVALREVLRSHATCAGVDAPIAGEPSGVLWCGIIPYACSFAPIF